MLDLCDCGDVKNTLLSKTMRDGDTLVIPPNEEGPEVDACRELANHSVLFNEAVAERLGLNTTDQRCLDLVERASREGPVTAGRLAELTGLTTGAVTGVLDRLERAGFVRREKDPEDRRQVQIKLDPERLPKLAALFEPLSEGFAELSSRHTPDQQAAIVAFLRGASALLARETLRLRSEEPDVGASPRGIEELASPLHAIREGRLEISRGASNLALNAMRGSLLYRVRYQGPAPSVQAREGHVHVQYNRSTLRLFDFRRHALQIDLNERVPWDVAIRGGASNLKADLRGLVLRQLELKGGANQVSFELPRAVSTVSVRVTGGANHLAFTRPKGVPARIQVSGGVSHLIIDRLELGAVGGTMRWESPDFASASDRYDLQISGGASHLSIGEC